MSDQLLPDFDGPQDLSDSTKLIRPKRSQRKRPAKKAAKRVPSPKLAKRMPKKRKVRKVGKHPALAAPYKPVDMAVQFTPDVYRLIAEMMKLPASERGLTIAIVQGLSGK